MGHKFQSCTYSSAPYHPRVCVCVQVSQVVVSSKDGEQKLDASLVVVGVGARPNVELLEGQVEMVPKPVGGIKVRCLRGRRAEMAPNPI